MNTNSNHTPPRQTLLGKWSAKLQERWGVSANRVFIILFVFACTGTTVLILKRPVVNYFSGGTETPLLFSVLYYIFILPIYNLILLVYGFIFGQFQFFWNFEKKMLKRMAGRFQSRK
ncbi:MAG: DUF6787 family protein [Crocinitomicaceae bacterium]